MQEAPRCVVTKEEISVTRKLIAHDLANVPGLSGSWGAREVLCPDFLFVVSSADRLA